VKNLKQNKRMICLKYWQISPTHQDSQLFLKKNLLIRALHYFWLNVRSEIQDRLTQAKTFKAIENRQVLTELFKKILKIDLESNLF